MNYDAAAPIIGRLTVNGKPIKAVAQLTKQSWAYVLDRVTGQPVWPIEERPVPQSDVPGEKSSPTQPHPTKPPAYARTMFNVPGDVIDFTPELRAQGLEILKRYRLADTPFNPPMLGDVKGMLGAIVPATATNWPGGGYDPETHTLFAPAGNTFGVRTLVAPPPGFTDIRYVSGVAGRPFAEVWGPGDCCAADAGIENRENLPQRFAPPPPPAGAAPAAPAAAEGGGGLNVQGLPIVKPPYGLLGRSSGRGVRSFSRAARRYAGPHPQPSGLKGQTIQTGHAATSGVGMVVTNTAGHHGRPQTRRRDAPAGRARLHKKTGRKSAGCDAGHQSDADDLHVAAVSNVVAWLRRYR